MKEIKFEVVIQVQDNRTCTIEIRDELIKAVANMPIYQSVDDSSVVNFTRVEIK